MNTISNRSQLFKIGKVFQKYLLAHILSGVYSEHALLLLFSVSKKGRKYLIANYEMLTRIYLARPIVRRFRQDDFGRNVGGWVTKTQG